MLTVKVPLKYKHMNNGKKLPFSIIISIGKNQFPAKSWHLRLLEKRALDMKKAAVYTHTETGESEG